MDEEVQTERTPVDIDALRHLADLNRVATSYYGFGGDLTEVSADSLLKVLSAMGVPVMPGCSNEAVLRAIRHAEDLPWMLTLPVCTVVRLGSEAELQVHLDDGQKVNAWYVLEDGGSGALEAKDVYVAPRLVDGTLRGRATFVIPDTLPLGYHSVYARIDEGEPVSAPLYVVPARLAPGVLSGEQRYWGVNVQAYSVMSRGSWGVGDAEDLADLIAVCGQERHRVASPNRSAAPDTQ